MARIIPGAELRVVEGMGHVLPAAEYEAIADAIARNARRAPIASPASARA
jgi:pimeloyl-ACP methyl ester carboxylesterase